MRLSLLASVVVGLANGLGLCLLSSSSSRGRRLRLNDEDERVDTSMPVAEDGNGVMKGAEEDGAEKDEDEDEEEDEDPLVVDETAGGANVGTAGNSPPLLLLCTPRSVATSSLSFPLSLTLRSCTLLALFLSSLSSTASSFSSLSFSLSLTTTAGSCRLFTAVIAPPVPAPKPSLRVGSNRPRSDERERGDADVAAVCEGEGSASDEMIGAGDGRFSLLVVRSGVRSSEASMRCAVCEEGSG